MRMTIDPGSNKWEERTEKRTIKKWSNGWVEDVVCTQWITFINMMLDDDHTITLQIVQINSDRMNRQNGGDWTAK